MIKNFFKYHPVHKKIVKYFDFLFLLRPSLFFPVWIMICSGMITSSMSTARYNIWFSDFNIITFLIFSGITLISSSTFIINQIYDMKTDQFNDKLTLFKDKISKNEAEKLYKKLLVVGFVLLIPTGLKNLIFGLILFYVWGILYNMKPYEFKQKAILGNVVNIFAGIILFFTGWCINSNISVDIIIISLPYLLCFLAVTILTAIPDTKGDFKTNKITFPIRFGKKQTLFFSVSLVIGAFILGIKNNDPIISTASLISLPFYIFNLFSMKLNNILRTIRFSIFNLSFFLMSVFPYLFIACIINFYLIKYYYWHRFNLHYISFLIDEQ